MDQAQWGERTDTVLAQAVREGEAELLPLLTLPATLAAPAMSAEKISSRSQHHYPPYKRKPQTERTQLELELPSSSAARA